MNFTTQQHTPQYLQDLNEPQREAVLHTDGPTMIIAGAGSGKTRVLTYRLAYIVDTRKADAFNILALTFTNKAAREMRERIGALIGTEAKNLSMGTFHSVFSKILRIEAQHIGYTNDFTIYDEDDAQSLVKGIVKEFNLDDKKYRPKTIRHVISNAKNHLVSPETFRKEHVIDDFTEVYARVYEVYNQRCFKANAMDFDDLLCNMVVLFDNRPEILHKYQHRFKYLMIDEYQDTNKAQYIICKKLAAVHHNICVVGDDAQSIYSFRGATIENILNFQRDYPEVSVFKLEQNYRSTSTIVDAANDVIARNQNQIPKKVFTKNEVGEPIRILVGNTDLEEAEKVVDTLRELKLRRSLFNKDFAILYRTNAQSRAIEDGLRKAGLVYKIFGGMSFYRRKEIKDVVAYMRLAVNPRDEEALKRVINYPGRGIGDTTIMKIIVEAQRHNLPLWDVVERAKSYDLGRSAGQVEQFALLINTFGAVSKREDAFTTTQYIIRHCGIMGELMKENSSEGVSRQENVNELLNAAREFCEKQDAEADKSLPAFLAEISLFTDQDQEIENDDFVSLMTIHAAKGLEFNAVFLVGLEEGLFPSSLSVSSREELEEERRLFYVAVTRARSVLTLSMAKSRFKYGDIQYNEPSRFVEEIDKKYLATVTRLYAENPRTLPKHQIQEVKTLTPLAKMDSNPAQQITATQTATPKAATGTYDIVMDLSIGTKVEHEKFGQGVVEKLEGTGMEVRAIIKFKTKGEKTLILRYAKLKVLG